MRDHSIGTAHVEDASATKHTTRSRPIRQGSFVLAVAAALAVAACAGGAGLDILEPVHSETGNYCVDEAQGLLRSSYGPGAKITKAQVMSTYNTWELWVRSTVCTDWIVFYPSVLQKDSMCTMPAYGSAPQLLTTMWGYGDCANLPAEGDQANLPVGDDRQ
jgi:hypothetical protein